MSRRPFLAALAAATAAAGCVQINHTGYDTAWRCAPDDAPKPPLRSQVYLFVLNGADPLEDRPLLVLRDEVTRAGYPMVYTAQRADVEWFYREMHRVAHDQPPARLLLAGYGVAAAKARELACRVSADGLPLDHLILLDPAGSGADLRDGERVPTTILRSHNWPAGRDIPGDASELAGVGHLSLPAHPAVAGTVVRLMTASAARVFLEPPESLPHLPLTDFPQPTPRPVLPAAIEPAVPVLPAPRVVDPPAAKN